MSQAQAKVGHEVKFRTEQHLMSLNLQRWVGAQNRGSDTFRASQEPLILFCLILFFLRDSVETLEFAALEAHSVDYWSE